MRARKTTHPSRCSRKPRCVARECQSMNSPNRKAGLNGPTRMKSHVRMSIEPATQPVLVAGTCDREAEHRHESKRTVRAKPEAKARLRNLLEHFDLPQQLVGSPQVVSIQKVPASVRALRNPRIAGAATCRRSPGAGGGPPRNSIPSPEPSDDPSSTTMISICRMNTELARYE